MFYSKDYHRATEEAARVLWKTGSPLSSEPCPSG